MQYKNEHITKSRLNVFLGWEHFNPVGNVPPGRMSQNLCGHLWNSNTRDAITLTSTPLSAPLTADHLTKSHLDSLPFKPATIGDSFGPAFTSHLFRLDIVVPPEMAGHPVHLLWDCNAEGMVLSDHGIPIQGLVGGNHWARRADSPLFPSRPGHLAIAGDRLRLYIEIACNGLFGAGRGGDIEPPDMTKRYTLDECCLAIFDRDAWALIHDVTLLAELVKHLPDTPRRVEALHVANAVVNAVDVSDRSTYAEGRTIAARFLSAQNGAAQSRVTTMLHSHIDLAWLWPMAATPAKGARTFATKLRLMEQYPQALYVQSQAQLYEWVKDNYPQLWKEVVQRVKDGRIVPVGATWVEMDCNIPSGESLVRQFVVGQAFFKEHFGITCEEFWLPDTFGYASQLPQIMKGCGVKNFMTQKLSWNLFNKFPHSTFTWEGLDGSSVLAHMPPADTYNSQAFPEEIIRSAHKNKDAGVFNDSILLVGHGDGGGGASPSMVESLLRMHDVDGVPRVEFGTPTQFFDRARAHQKELPRWVGELYFELHRGTYTSQAKTKLANRYCELLLRDAELVAWMLATVTASKGGLQKYPRELLTKCWKLVLKNCFHDTLPGSCIAMVYEETTRDYDFVIKELRTLIDSSLVDVCKELKDGTGNGIALKRLKTENGHVAVSNDESGNGTIGQNGRVAFVRGPVFNCGNGPFVMEVDNAVETFGEGVLRQKCIAERMIFDLNEKDKMSDGRELIALERRPNGIGLVEVAPAIQSDSIQLGHSGEKRAHVIRSTDGMSYVMDNGLVEVVIHQNGRIVNMKLRRGDNEAREVVETVGCDSKGYGNRLVLYDDVPMFWDAWDTEAYSFEKSSEIGDAVSCEIVESGPLRAALVLKYAPTKAGSTIEQTVTLRVGSARLDFFTKVDWKESRKLLRAEFDVEVRSESACYDSQFGFVRRPTTANHSWEVAKFEVVAQRFADLSEHGFGVALMSDCKYGFSVRDRTMRVSLLRSAKSPDDGMDMGSQSMTYALLPHEGAFPCLGVFAEAAELNEPARILDGVTARDIGVNESDMAFRVRNADGDVNGADGVMVSAVKLGERDGRTVVRLFETMGGRAKVLLSVPEMVGRGGEWSVQEVDMLERDVQKEDGAKQKVVKRGAGVEVRLGAFEIVTLAMEAVDASP